MTHVHRTPTPRSSIASEQKDTAEQGPSFTIIEQDLRDPEEQSNAAGVVETNSPQLSSEVAGIHGKTEAMSEPSGKNEAPATLTPASVLRVHASAVYSLAWRLLSNESEAEDVTQDVLLKAIRNLASFRDDVSLRSWLHHYTVKTALAVRNKLGSGQELQEKFLENCVPTTGPRGTPVRSWSVPQQQNLSKELHQLIEEAIGGLPRAEHDVYVLGDIEGLPRTEIAALLGMSLTAVKSCLHRARLVMRDTLASHFEGQ
jgi:RNA polymerase sigma-70 factor (ECF subfamily)